MIGNLVRINNSKFESYLKNSSLLEDDVYNKQKTYTITIKKKLSIRCLS